MKIIWLVNFAILFAFIKVFEIPSMFPFLVDDLHISYAQAGLFMTAYTIMSIAAMIVPTHSSGKALGVIFTFGYGGSILGSYSGGYLLEKTGHYDPSFILFSVSFHFQSLA